MRQISGLADIADRMPPGTGFAVHSACAAPPRLCGQLAELAAAAGPFDILDLTTLGTPAYAEAVLAGALRLRTYVPGRAVRRGLATGNVEAVPHPLSRAPRDVAEGRFPLDVALLHLSPADPDGRCSLGVSCDLMPAVLARRPLVVAEIDPNMPRTHGATAVPVDRIDFWIEGGDGPTPVGQPEGDARDHAIADHVASLVRAGDVLQSGIGAIPDLTAARLGHLSRLGIHTGILTEALMPLIESGVVTNETKPEFRGVSVSTLAAGSAGFYRFLDDNRAIEFHPCDVTHDAAALARIPRLCAINGALEIDLRGNVNAESVDGRRVSGPGGQPDFAPGARASDGGKSIIALRATSKDGATSRIVAGLADGVVPTIGAADVTHVVTEFGVAKIADLRGIALRDALAEIAAPEFRADLRRAGG